jgi:hypothetical protein
MAMDPYLIHYRENHKEYVRNLVAGLDKPAGTFTYDVPWPVIKPLVHDLDDVGLGFFDDDGENDPTPAREAKRPRGEGP